MGKSIVIARNEETKQSQTIRFTRNDQYISPLGKGQVEYFGGGGKRDPANAGIVIDWVSKFQPEWSPRAQESQIC